MLARATSLLTLALALAVTAAPAQAAPRLLGIGNFDQPVHVTGAPGDYERLYVVEKPGRIQMVQGGQASEFLDLTDAVQDIGSEEGLLSVAFAPDFAVSRLLYVYFTDNNGDNRVEELRAPGPDSADPATRRPVIVLEHPEEDNHNGGQLQFGPDGMLYIAPGDGGSSKKANAQNLGSELGKILRIDPRQSGSSPYTVPTGNPFASGAVPEIWAYGLRNPFRFSFDRRTGDLTVGDVGQGATEEIDWVPASQGAGRGVNFGWADCEGSFAETSTSIPCSLSGARNPVLDLFQHEGWRAVIGGYVVNDPSLPLLFGRYAFADNGRGELWSARLALPEARDLRYSGTAVTAAASFGEDAEGCLYVVQLTGQVSRVVENDTRVPCPQGALALPAVADRTAPRLRARVKRRQRVLRLRGAVARVSCNERCSIAAGGRLKIGRRSFRMRRVSRAAKADKRARIRVALSRRGRRALKNALKKRRRATVRIAIRATDPAGNRSRLTRRSVLVRR